MLLASRFELFDIDDVEALCVRGARRWARNTEVFLTPTEFEELVSFLIIAVWKMSTRYDRELSSSFSAIVVGRLGNRCTDWLRSHRGRTKWVWADGKRYEREARPNNISLDAPVGADGRTLADVVAAVDSDPAPGGGADLFGGLLDGRDREAAWDLAFCRALARRLLQERNQRARAT